MAVTRPTSTSNTLITVLFTSMPSALLIYSVTSGPVLRMWSNSSQPPVKRAMSGISQTIKEKLRLRRIFACGSRVEECLFIV